MTSPVGARSRYWRRGLSYFAAAAVTLAMFWGVGLAWFVQSSLMMTADRTIDTDAIVVLTGGRLRLEAGLDLLGAGRAQKLFISGVNPHVHRLELMRVNGHADDSDLNRIVIGHAAADTLGNARETADWMRQQGYRSLRLVTSWYHMRRSLLEFERAMPDAQIVPEPVFAGRPEGEGWLDVALLTISEYDKYLATLVRPEISAIWSRAGDARATDSAESALEPRHQP